MIAPVPVSKNISELFAGSSRFYIPIYQRSGAWKVPEATKFYEDYVEFVESYEKGWGSPEKQAREVHFLGAIYLAKNAEKSSELGINAYDVVDGQQRLTMITLFACALKRSLFSHLKSHERLLSEQDKQFIELRIIRLNDYLYYDSSFIPNNPGSKSFFWPCANDPESATKLVLSDDDRDKYISAVNPESATKNSNFKKTIQHLSKQLISQMDSLAQRKISISDWYAKFAEPLFTKTRVIMVTLESMRDAYETFERLNDRGVRLSVFDLLNIRLTRKFSDDATKQFEYKTLIGRIKSLCEKTGVRPHEAFQKFYMITKSIVSYADVPEKFSKEWNSFEEIIKGLRKIEDMLISYSHLFSKEEEELYLAQNDPYYFREVEIYKTLQTPYFRLPLAYIHSELLNYSKSSVEEITNKMNNAARIAYRISWNANLYNSSMGVLINSALRYNIEKILNGNHGAFNDIGLNVQMESGIVSKSVTEVILIGAIYYKELLKGEYTPENVGKAKVVEPADETVMSNVKKIKIGDEIQDFDASKFVNNIDELRKYFDWKT